MLTRPEVGLTRPATSRSNVDFPQPEGPRTATNSVAADVEAQAIERGDGGTVIAHEHMTHVVKRDDGLHRQFFGAKRETTTDCGSSLSSGMFCAFAVHSHVVATRAGVNVP